MSEPISKARTAIVVILLAVVAGAVCFSFVETYRRESNLQPPAQSIKPPVANCYVTAANAATTPYMCAGAATGTVMLPPAQPARDPIAELRAEAHKRGLKWKIFCTGAESGDSQFQAEAIGSHQSWESTVEYVEHGGIGFWAGNGATQQDAAKELLREMAGERTIQPRHEPKEPEHKKVCPPELSGN